MALNPQQFQQLPMFMTAHDLMTQTVPNDVKNPGPGDIERLWATKLRKAQYQPASNESGSQSLAESVRTKGVQRPVELAWSSHQDKPKLVNGHRRVTVALQADPDRLVPVIHHDEATRFTNINRYFGWK